MENEIASISGLATNSALTAVEKKIPNVSGLVKKTTDYNTKINETESKITDHNHDKNITTPEFNKLTTEHFKTSLKQADLVTKTEHDTKLQEFSKRITSNKSRHLLAENELRKLHKSDAGYFIGKNHFEEDVTLKYLVFQPLYKYFKTINSIGNISGWKSKGLSNGSIKTSSTSYKFLNPLLNHVGTKIRVKSSGSCLKQNAALYNHGAIVNIYTVYEISKNYNISNYPTLGNSLFGAVNLTKHADIDQYKYSGCGIGFDRKGEFSFGSNRFGGDVIILGADMSSSVHANNKTKNILDLGKDFVQGLDNTTIYAAKMYSVSFTENNKKKLFKLAL